MKPEAEAIFRESSLMRFLPQEQHAWLRPMFSEERYDFGDLILQEGQEADAFYLLTAGRARVVKTDPQGNELSLNLLHPGDEFGEAALLSGGIRTATVRCSTPVEALRLTRADFLSVLERHPELKNVLELRTRWKALHNFLYEYSNFGRLPAPALGSLLEKLQPESFPKGRVIFREGQAAGPVYIIKEGKVRIYQEQDGTPRNLAFLREGDFFGELSVLNASPRAGTAEALSDCLLLALPPGSVEELNGRFPEFANLMQERLAQYSANIDARIPLDFSKELLPAEATLNLREESERKPAAQEEPAADVFEEEGGLFRKRQRRIQRLPFVQQIDEMDCGAACLAMVCRHFGRKVSLVRIRQLCYTSHDGTSLKAICQAAQELGLAARAMKVSLRNLPHLPLPAIVHWEGNHWIVLFDVAPKWVRVMDPASGLRRLPRSEFEQKWSGYAALFDYTEKFDFAPESRPTLAWLVPFFRRFRPVLMQVFLLALVVNSLLLLLPFFTQVVVDKVIIEGHAVLLPMVIVGLMASQGFLLASSLIQQYLLSFVSVRIDAEMLDFLTRQLLALPMSYFHSRRTGDIQRRLEGLRQIRQFIVQQGIGALLAVAQLAASLCLMALYHALLLGVFLLTVPLYVGLMLFSIRVMRPLYADLEESHGKYGSHQIDAIKGIEAVKASAAEPAFREAMLNEFLSVARTRFRSQFLSLSYQSVLQAIGLVSTALFLWVGAKLVLAQGLTVGAFVAFSALLGLAGASILRILGMWDELQMVTVLLNRMNDVFEHEPEQGRDRTRLTPVRTLEGHLELRNLGFRYGGPEAPSILTDIDLEIPPGRTIALVGRSGCGKTTLIKLLAGLIEPTEGMILYDRVDLRTLNYRDLRRKIGIVLQENHIFSDTILRNIAFGDPEPDFDRVLRASQLANAHEFIMRLPLGYETRIGETGLALSGGQRQRIAIARAVYPDPPLLIFDEATSALDTESERAIQNNLGRLMSGRTSIVIAHRLSTIRDADRIVVLEKGQIVESGTHDELMALRGLYFYLSSQQLGI